MLTKLWHVDCKFSGFKMQMTILNSLNILHLAPILTVSASGAGVEVGARAGAGKEAGAREGIGARAGAGAGLGAEAGAQERSYLSQFPCQCQPPSYRKPRDKDHVRLGDIEILGAIGDSDTAAYAARSTGIHSYFTDYFGASFSTGTDGSWRTAPTLANLLKACNPGLQGGSQGAEDLILPGTGGAGGGFSSRGLNVAVSGDTTAEGPGQASKLAGSIRRIPGWQNRWKLVTIQLGGNDICINSCNSLFGDGSGTPDRMTANLGETLKMLSSLPCTLVLLLAPSDFSQLDRTPDKGLICDANLRFSCNCLYQGDVAENSKKFKYLSHALTEGMEKIARQYTRADFGVEVLPALTSLPPRDFKGRPLRNSFSHDCLHYTARMQGRIGLNIYNNLVDPVGQRDSNYGRGLAIKCPSQRNPYISTRANSCRTQGRPYLGYH